VHVRDIGSREVFLIPISGEIFGGAPRWREYPNKTSVAQSADLFRTMTAYTGKFKFDGKVVEHDVDISWNEVWTGTKQIRYAKKEGNRIILTTPKMPRPIDGKMSETILIWEKVN